MSTRDKTFIDAYGLELSDELEASYAEPTLRQAVAVHKPARIDDAEQREQSYRFDAAARHRTLRGPHFDMRRVGSQTADAASPWDAFDTSVIDVGATWASSCDAAPPAFDEQDIAEAASPVVTQTEVTAPDTEVAVVPEQPVAAAVEIEPHAAKTSVPAIDSAERFSPVWEVDRFHWPNDIEQLFKTQTDYFDYAGKKLVAASREGLSSLLITSTRSGEGSTTLALCLARAAAGAGAKVGLVDGNLHRSELGERLGVDFASGWQTAAAFERPLAEVAIIGLEEGITLFPSAPAPVAELASLGDDRVGQFLRGAAANCDLLIIDAGQADLGGNIQAFDAAIVVRDIRHTSEAETLAVAASLRNQGVKAVGIAENFGSSQAIRAAA
jgi:Mrp family chromosome partitioning ATPase